MQYLYSVRKYVMIESDEDYTITRKENREFVNSPAFRNKLEKAISENDLFGYLTLEKKYLAVYGNGRKGWAKLVQSINR